MATLQDFNIYKMRAGQGYKLVGSVYTDTFDNAKKEFASNCYNDLLNGKHGDNFIEEEEGVFCEGELFFDKEDLKEGITSFTEDVYTWELRNTFKFIGLDEDEDVMNEVFASSLEEAQKMMEGYGLKVKKA
ncbi:hypothetical protein [Tenacibaculum finnmarkense]|uniref:hypothetical protein n=1 Tax=Tenacibaculum finnmarkense TaxID=2781243 RepID=UPI00187B43A1|nr:hypothetical protein [Tenacibaculum finnmarkense]MBE7649258.1 hypothetical protein [Tenacibaculum finnmarkense genomovar ulcerans]